MTARALTDLLAPDRFAVLLLDMDANRLTLVHDHGPAPTKLDDPLLQLAFRAGPLLFGRNVRAAALGHGAMRRHISVAAVAILVAGVLALSAARA